MKERLYEIDIIIILIKNSLLNRLINDNKKHIIIFLTFLFIAKFF